MEIYQALEGRRSVRKYVSPATDEQLDRILKAAALAPSPFNRQAWDVVVVKNPDLIDQIAEIKYQLNLGLSRKATDKTKAQAQRQKDAFNNASLLVVYQRERNNDREIRYDAGGGWLLMGNILIAAMAEGLGSRIISFWDEAEEKVDRLLKVPAERKQISAVNIGVPDPSEVIEPRKLKPAEKWIHFEQFP